MRAASPAGMPAPEWRRCRGASRRERSSSRVSRWCAACSNVPGRRCCTGSTGRSPRARVEVLAAGHRSGAGRGDGRRRRGHQLAARTSRRPRRSWAVPTASLHAVPTRRRASRRRSPLPAPSASSASRWFGGPDGADLGDLRHREDEDVLGVGVSSSALRGADAPAAASPAGVGCAPTRRRGRRPVRSARHAFRCRRPRGSGGPAPYAVTVTTAPSSSTGAGAS